MDNDALEKFIEEKDIKCPVCGKHDFTPIRKFNLMFKTYQGVTEDSVNTVYLRPETAQGIFVNFKNVQRSTRMRVVLITALYIIFHFGSTINVGVLASAFIFFEKRG